MNWFALAGVILDCVCLGFIVGLIVNKCKKNKE